MNRWIATAAASALATLLATPAHAQHRKVVDGLTINIGVTPAAQVLNTDPYERDSHRAGSAVATHHVVVGVADAKTGTPVADAKVTLEVVDPRGASQRKTLLRGDAGGAPDYSELFRFGWAGNYTLKVNVERAGAAPVQSSFRWTQTY